MHIESAALETLAEEISRVPGEARRRPLIVNVDREGEVTYVGTQAVLACVLDEFHAVLRRSTGKTPEEAALYMVTSSHLSGAMDRELDITSARGLGHMSPDKVAQLLGMALVTQRPHERMGDALMVGSVDAERMDVCETVACACKELGAALAKAREETLGAFVVRERGAGASWTHVLDVLVAGCPALFAEASQRKARRVVWAVSCQMGEPAEGCAFIADPVLTAWFVRRGVLAGLSVSWPREYTGTDVCVTAAERTELRLRTCDAGAAIAHRLGRSQMSVYVALVALVPRNALDVCYVSSRNEKLVS